MRNKASRIALVIAVAALEVVGHSATSSQAALSSWPVYVPSPTTNDMTIIDSGSNTAGTAFPVGNNPQNLVITKDGSTGWIADYDDTDVVPINLTTHALGTPVSVPGNPEAVAITPDGSTLIVPDCNGEVNFINLHSFAVTTVSGGGSCPSNVVVTPDGATAYVMTASQADVYPISIASKTFGTPITTGQASLGMAISPDGQTVYADDDVDQDIVEINVTSNTVTSTISLPFQPGQILVTPDGNAAFVSNAGAGALYPVNLKTKTVGTAITGVSEPGGMAITPDARTLYVGDYGLGTVTPVDLTNNTAGTPITVSGPFPVWPAMAPDFAPVAQMTTTAKPAGTPTTFDASASTVKYGTIASYAWNFGDGSQAVTSTPNTTHIYMAAGQFTATVTETSSGGTSTTSIYNGQMFSHAGSALAAASTTLSVKSIPVPGSGGAF